MNIDEYRAYKEQDAKEAEVVVDAQVEQGTVIEPQEVVQETTQEQPTPQEVTAETATQTVPSEFDALKAERDQLIAQQQEIAKALKEAEEAKLWYAKINEDPDYAKTFAEDKGLVYVDPQEKAVQEVQQRYQALLLEKEINNLSLKYPDFNAQVVVQTALNKGIQNLEDAYLLTKATAPQTNSALDMEALREQIRQEVQNELQSKVSTTSIIGSGGAGSQQIQPNEVELSTAELKIAKNMGLSPKEYHTWKTRK